MLLVGLLAVLSIGYPNGAPPYRLSDNEALNLPVRWDAGWYLRVANEGYSWDADSAGQQPIVFFPAYPLLVRMLAAPLGGTPAAFILSGLLVSWAAFTWALVYVHRLAMRSGLTRPQATAAVWLLAVYPFAVFYGALYTEALFLLSSVGCFYHVHRREWLPASAWGLLAGLTRPTGWMLTAPLALVAARPLLPRTARRWIVTGDDPAEGRGSWLAPAMAAATPALATLVYSAYVYTVTGRPFAWASGHAAWGRHYEGLSGLGRLFSTRIGFVASFGLDFYVRQSSYDGVNLLAAAFALVAVVPVTLRFGVAYGGLVLMNVVAPLMTGGFLSAGRITSVLFPLFLWLGACTPVRWRLPLTVTFVMGQALLASLFFTWRPLF